MAISFTEIQSLGDVLPNNRHVLYFPSLPSLFNGHDLTLRHTQVSMPPLQVGQIIVKQLGWSVAFAGMRQQQNTFTCEFVETSGAPVVQMLARWQDICAGLKSPLAKRKIDSAVKCMLIAYDGKGEKALVVSLLNVWPVDITYGQYSEDSAASMVNVTFSTDGVDFANIVPTDGDYELPSASANNSSNATPALWYTSLTGTDVSQPSASATGANISAQIASALQLNNPQALNQFALA